MTKARWMGDELKLEMEIKLEPKAEAEAGYRYIDLFILFIVAARRGICFDQWATSVT